MDAAGIQALIDGGAGIASTYLGLPFTVYRIDSNSTGDFPNGWTIVGVDSLVYRTKIKDTGLEQALFGSDTLWYQLIGDMSVFLLGDTFVQNSPQFLIGDPSPGYGAGATLLQGSRQFDGFVLAWHPPVSLGYGARADRRARIYRTARTGVGTSGQGRLQNQPLIMAGGTYSWGTTDQTASWVPLGLASSMREMRRMDFAAGTMAQPPVQRYYGYTPPLPGYTPRENDILIIEDGSQFVVVQPFYQEAGVVGNQMALDRMASQT